MASPSSRQWPKNIAEYYADVAKINTQLPTKAYFAMVDRIRTDHLSDAEMDIIVESRMKRKEKEGIITAKSDMPSNFSIAVPPPQSNPFDTFMSRKIEQETANRKTPKYIDSGAFGVIYQNPSNPSKVIKILIPSVNIDVLIQKAETIARITGDKRQRVEAISITKNAVPSNALQKYAELNAAGHFMKNQPIPALSMPYLGVNLITYLDKIPFALSEELYLSQCHKLLQQTDKLYKSGYSHGDLHSENIVFDGTEMTIIDFDIFGTFEKVAIKYESDINRSESPYTNVIRSWTPPEFLILYNTLPKLRNESGTEKSKRAIAKDYTKKLYERSPDYFSSSGITLDILRTRIEDSNKKNLDYMTKHDMSMIGVIPYLDNFGLGMALLEVFARLYRDTANPKLIKTRELLEKITQFNISKRITPDVAFAEMDQILKMSGGRQYFTGKTRRTYKNRSQGGAKRSYRRNKKSKHTRRRHK